MGVIIRALVVIWCGLLLARPLEDPDLWWHLTVGRWIMAHGQVPRVDYWNLFARGEPWIAYSWSTEVVFAIFERFGGITGVLVAQTLLAVTLVGALVAMCIRICRDDILGVILGVAAAIGCHANFSLRPQTLSWLYQVGIIIAAHEMVSGGVKARWCVLLGLSLCLWANSNITTVIGVVIALVWLYPLFTIRSVAGWLALVFLPTLCTPYLGQEWLTFLAKADHPLLLTSIQEFAAATIKDTAVGLLVVLWFFFSTICWFVRSPRELRLIALAGGITLGGLTVVKFIPNAFIVLAAVVATFWSKHREAVGLGGFNDTIAAIRASGNALVGPGLGFFLIALSTVRVFALAEEVINRETVPVAEVDMFVSRNLPHPLLNTFGHGGYIMYRLSDLNGNLATPVMIDGRTNVNRPDITVAFYSAWRGTENWERYLDLVQPNSILWNNASPLVALLLESGQWCRVHRSGQEITQGFSLFIKRAVYTERYRDLFSDNCPSLQ